MEIYADVARLLGEKKLVRLTEYVTLHQQYQLEDLATANKWELPEALHIALANGLAFKEAIQIGRTRLVEEAATTAEGEGPGQGFLPGVAAHWQELAHRLDTRYATLKFMAFRLMQNNQTLKFNLSGLTNGLAMGRGTTSFLQKERERVEQLNQLLRQEHCVNKTNELSSSSNNNNHSLPAPAHAPSYPVQTIKPATTTPTLTLAEPGVKYLIGGAACYELGVIEELCEAASSQLDSAENPLPDPLLDLGFLVLEGITNSQAGDLPLAVLERAGQEIGCQASLTDSSSEEVAQALKFLDHFLSARSTTLVMEGKVAFLKVEGEQLEEEVQGLREQEWAWHEWSTSMRAYLARLELENKQLTEPQQLELSQPEPESSWFSLVRWFKEKLFSA